MKIGKLTIKDLKELILKNIKHNRKEVITNPEIGGDCAIIETSGEDVIYLSSDPITGATKEIGKLAININANDIATSGVSPLGVMMTILAPVGTKKEELESLIKEAQNECDKLNIEILGGHTEITDGVTRIIVSVTAIGIGKKSVLKERKKVTHGDVIILTKGAGIEGTGIIAGEKSEDLIMEFGEEFVSNAKKYLEKTSVIKEGLIGSKYSKGMHDATEGGIFGGIWESCELYGLGCKIEEDRISIGYETRKICEYYKINPYKLISSGSMLIIASQENEKSLLMELSKNGIEGNKIGVLTENNEKIVMGKDYFYEIESPESDELYKVLK